MKAQAAFGLRTSHRAEEGTRTRAPDAFIYFASSRRDSEITQKVMVQGILVHMSKFLCGTLHYRIQIVTSQLFLEIAISLNFVCSQEV